MTEQKRSLRQAAEDLMRSAGITAQDFDRISTEPATAQKVHDVAAMIRAKASGALTEPQILSWMHALLTVKPFDGVDVLAKDDAGAYRARDAHAKNILLDRPDWTYQQALDWYDQNLG